MTHPPEVDAGPAAPWSEQHELFELPQAMRDISNSATQAAASPSALRPDPTPTPRMVISINAPSPSAPFPPLDLDSMGEGGRRSTTALDLDTMARIAEEAGRDAVRGRADQAPFDNNPALRANLTTDDMLVTATRLYQACIHGALDPATD